jgi:uncharacterized protein (DUF1697 family)
MSLATPETIIKGAEAFRMEEQETPKQNLERLGAAKVRILLQTGNLVQHLVAPATQWLAELDEAERSRNEASQASQIRTALSAKKAAWIAAIAAIIAAVVAIISTVLTYLSWIRSIH